MLSPFTFVDMTGKLILVLSYFLHFLFYFLLNDFSVFFFYFKVTVFLIWCVCVYVSSECLEEFESGLVSYWKLLCNINIVFATFKKKLRLGILVNSNKKIKSYLSLISSNFQIRKLKHYKLFSLLFFLHLPYIANIIMFS